MCPFWTRGDGLTSQELAKKVRAQVLHVGCSCCYDPEPDTGNPKDHQREVLVTQVQCSQRTTHQHEQLQWLSEEPDTKATWQQPSTQKSRTEPDHCSEVAAGPGGWKAHEHDPHQEAPTGHNSVSSYR